MEFNTSNIPKIWQMLECFEKDILEPLDQIWINGHALVEKKEEICLSTENKEALTQKHSPAANFICNTVQTAHKVRDLLWEMVLLSKIEHQQIALDLQRSPVQSIIQNLGKKFNHSNCVIQCTQPDQYVFLDLNYWQWTQEIFCRYVAACSPTSIRLHDQIVNGFWQMQCDLEQATPWQTLEPGILYQSDIFDIFQPGKAYRSALQFIVLHRLVRLQKGKFFWNYPEKYLPVSFLLPLAHDSKS